MQWAVFEEASRALAAGGRPDLLAIAYLDLARARAAQGNRDGAVVSACAAHAGALRLAATPLRDQAASILRQLGASTPRPASARTAVLAKLTPGNGRSWPDCAEVRPTPR
jgi:hypothetical protein